MTARTYGNADIQRITGLSKMQILHLTQSQVITPLEDARGRGRRRRYAWSNIVEFLLCRELYKIQMPVMLMLATVHSLQLPGIQTGKDKYVSFWDLYMENPETERVYLCISFDEKGSETISFMTWYEISEVLKKHTDKEASKKAETHSLTLINLRGLIAEAEAV